jgi:HAD superfamily hydrolase (TIGR01549 family)
MEINGRHIAGVIFDIDGTLVDTFPLLTSIFTRSLRQFNLSPVPLAFLVEGMKKNMGLGEILRLVFPLEAEEALIEDCRLKILEQFHQAEETEVALFPGVHELFQGLKHQGIQVGIATGRTSDPDREWARFKRYGVDAYIDSIVTSKDVEHRKPAPDVLIACAKRLKVPIENCLVLGDTESDVVAAKKAGAIAIAVSTGQDGHDLLKKENPDFLFRTLREFSLFLKETGDRSDPKSSSYGDGGQLPMGLSRDLFNFAAKAGCLEGYLHDRKDPDISTMPNWVGNLERMYRALPPEVRQDLACDLRKVLQKAMASYETYPNKDHTVLERLRDMVAGLPSL